MSVLDLNPFRPTRWEHQRTGHHLIWFPKAADKLVEQKSVYVRGSRGSGKTTLLKSICWEDLTLNRSLMQQHNFTDFGHIGVYIKFPDHISVSFSYPFWGRLFPNAPDPDFEMHRFFSLAVELVCLDRCLFACHDLRVAGHVSFTASDEKKIVRDIVDEFPALDRLNDPPQTFFALGRVCRNMLREMNEACGRGTLITLLDRLPHREPGELLKHSTRRLSNSLRLVGAADKQDIGFKFCLDDCEVLSAVQQKSLNTLVRISDHPVSWIVSSVGSFFDTSTTFIEQQPLTDHDRRILPLDARTPDEFRTLCQAVISLRLYFSVSEGARSDFSGEISNFFSLDKRLGSKNVNDIFSLIVSGSTSPHASLVKTAAEKLKDILDNIGQPYLSLSDENVERLPYYEAYVLLLWHGREDTFKTTFVESDLSRLSEFALKLKTESFQAWLRRKQVAALLHFADKLGFRRLPLAGLPMISALADGSVRDFLEIIGEIYQTYCAQQKIDRKSTAALNRFATSRTMIGRITQSKGIYAASISYLEGISNRSELDAGIVTRFIDGFGHYTSLLQSNSNDPTVLGRAERGIFAVRAIERGGINDSNEIMEIEQEEQVWNVIRQAELAGYIRTTESVRYGAGASRNLPSSDLRIVSFRLHHRFAPHFRFSYRGAYEPIALSIEDIVQLLDRTSRLDSRAWAQRMASRPIKGSEAGQLQLILNEPNNEH